MVNRDVPERNFQPGLELSRESRLTGAGRAIEQDNLAWQRRLDTNDINQGRCLSELADSLLTAGRHVYRSAPDSRGNAIVSARRGDRRSCGRWCFTRPPKHRSIARADAELHIIRACRLPVGPLAFSDFAQVGIDWYLLYQLVNDVLTSANYIKEQTRPLHFARPELAQKYLQTFQVGLISAQALFAPRRMGKSEFLGASRQSKSSLQAVPRALCGGCLVVQPNHFTIGRR
jgi:hypothetical protein